MRNEFGNSRRKLSLAVMWQYIIMAYLRCTGKLLKFLGKEAVKAAKLDISDESDDDWYAHLLWIDRRKCIIFTNVGTLFPFVVPDISKSKVLSFPKFFLKEYKQNLIQIGATGGQIKAELSRLRQLSIGKTRNRSILGSMNDYIYQVRAQIELFGSLKQTNPSILNERLAEAPMGAINYSNGITELKIKLNSFAT